MKYSNLKNTLSFADVKLAALLFDRVVPLNGMFWLDMNSAGDLRYRVYSDLLGIADVREAVRVDRIHDFIRGSDELFRKSFAVYSGIGSDYTSGAPSRIHKDLYSDEPAMNRFVNAFVSLYEGFKDKAQLSQDGTDWTAVLASFHVLGIDTAGFSFRSRLFGLFSDFPFAKDEILLSLPPFAGTLASPTKTDLSIAVSQIDLIDTTSLSWEAVLEIRSDPDAVRKLRNFRLFVCENYAGRSKTFIEDDIARRLEEYDGICRDYALKTTVSTLTSLMDSKSILGGAALATSALLLGHPIVASSALLGGISLEIGKICINIAANRHAFNKFGEYHPLAYLVDCSQRSKK